MMKSNFMRLLMVGTLVLTMFLTGCASSKASAVAEEEIANADAPIKLNIAGGTATGTLFMVASGVTECINRSYPGSVATIVPGSGGANVSRLSNNEVDAGLANSVMLFSGAKGEAPFEETFANTAAVGSLFTSTLQIVMEEKMGITSLDEIIKDKMKVKISIDQPGSGTAVAFEKLLKEYGTSIEEFEGWGGTILMKGQEDSASMLTDGFIDGYALLTMYPARPIQESAVSQKLVMLSIDPAVLRKMTEKYGYVAGTIPKDSYDFMTGDIASLSTTMVLAVPADASDEIAYKLAKSIVENLEYFSQVHAGLNGLTADFMTKNTGVPLHPGAIKYYKEIGVLK
jgi:uncharacterized protein